MYEKSSRKQFVLNTLILLSFEITETITLEIRDYYQQILGVLTRKFTANIVKIISLIKYCECYCEN